MMRSMFAAVSGLRNHQTMMDVLASNISNVNTFGYKAQRTTFKDSLYQNLSGAGAPVPPSLGGTNPRQVGLGMSLNSIDTLMTQGNSQSTGVVTDMMIQGDGFFRVAAPGSTFGGVGGNDVTGGGEQYTRAGNFSFDSQGYLVTTKGQYVLGTVADLLDLLVEELLVDQGGVLLLRERPLGHGLGSRGLRGHLWSPFPAGSDSSGPLQA